MNRKLIISLIYLAILILLVANLEDIKAQTTRRIATECNASTIDSNYSYIQFDNQGYTAYIVVLTAGRCQRSFPGRIQSLTNLNQLIQSDINSQIISRDIYFNLSSSQPGGARGNGGHRVP